CAALLGGPQVGRPGRPGDDRPGLALQPRLGPDAGTSAAGPRRWRSAHPDRRLRVLTGRRDDRDHPHRRARGVAEPHRGPEPPADPRRCGHAWAVAYSPDGRSLALGGFAPDIILCDLELTGAERPMGIAIEQTKALAFSPDGRTLAAASTLSDQIL